MAIPFSQDLENVHKVDINKLCDALSIETVAGKEFVTFALANCLLFERKQLDYGSRNVSAFGSFGQIVKANDKFERLKHIYGRVGRKKRAVNEAVLDSFRDISNYCIIAAMLEKGAWPNE